MRMKKLYPGLKEAEEQKSEWRKHKPAEEPDFISGKPNYDKYPYMTPEQVLVMLNID